MLYLFRTRDGISQRCRDIITGVEEFGYFEEEVL